MNDQIFQLVLLGINGFGALFFWAMHQEIRNLKELLSVRLESLEKRIEKVEKKCEECPAR